MQVSNSEAVFDDFHVQMFFSTENLWDPTIIQNEELESSPLGSKSNYRAKFIVSMITSNNVNICSDQFIWVHCLKEILILTCFLGCCDELSLVYEKVACFSSRGTSADLSRFSAAQKIHFTWSSTKDEATIQSTWGMAETQLLAHSVQGGLGARWDSARWANENLFNNPWTR